MRKETITYTDYNDIERTEDFYFNVTKTELLRMEADKNGAFSTVLEKFVKAKDVSDAVKANGFVVVKEWLTKTVERYD